VPRAIPDTGVPIALGLVPLVFSALLFVVPVVRAIARPWRKREALEERGRLALLREVIERVKSKKPITDADVAAAWRRATGRPAGAKRLDRELVALGGDVAIEPSGQTRWRFADFETEASALEAERAAAADEEARLGEIVYATDER
jgi:SOS response regulatory protein OraA/RecX